MTQPVYAGIALGGSKAGQMIEASIPKIRINPKISVIGVKQKMEEYYYVPLVGLQGFWLSDTETKGTGPWDDIIRVLSTSYVETHATPNKPGRR